MRNVTCWLGWPPGHLYESVAYRDAVSARWRAFARCLRCGRTRPLAVGDPHRPSFANPLVTALSLSLRPVQPPRRERPAPPSGAVEVTVPASGETLSIRAARVAWGPWRGTTVYCARVVGPKGRATAARDLRAAVARAARSRTGDGWIDDLARQLEHELAP